MRSAAAEATAPDRAVRALAKPEVQRLAARAAGLGPYQDEKLEFFSKHMQDMGSAFQQARGARGGLQEEYDRRNQKVLNRVAEIRASTDARSRQHHERLKVFSIEFETELERRRSSWREEMEAHDARLTRQGGAIAEATSGLSAAIQQEYDDCLAHTEAETGPLVELLKEHSANLEQQVAARARQDGAFRQNVIARFAELKKSVADEAQAREGVCKKDKAELEVRFTGLRGRLSRLDGQLQQGLEALRTAMAAERVERSKAQEALVHQTTTFLGQNEAAATEARARQEEARKVLATLRSTMRDSL